MRKPKMILFDYGNTLLYEPDWNAERGNHELFKHIIRNPNNCSYDEIVQEVNAVFCEVNEVRKTFNYDIPCTTAHKLAYERLGIEFSLTPLQREVVFWSAATPGAIVSHTEAMLEYLEKNKIRSAVISNNSWSGEAIKERIDRLLPNNRFEFVLSSCDYLVRKPDRRLFDIALAKAGLSADEAWYCGDSVDADVYGAKNAGLFPVLFTGETPGDDSYKRGHDNLPADFNYLHVHDWCEMIDALESLR